MFILSQKTFTKYILKVAKYIPFVFPESVVFFSKDIDENNDDSIWKKRDEKFNSISYFSGAFKWKAITLSSIITKNEVSIIEEKISKLKINFVPKFFGKFSDTSIEH
ncbi:hypothetical protein JXG70_004468, partial [Salmonella enterica subsp. enterica serovar Muenchen]|nr:hypothetical protein [Salmonella enterica subsp. enterica serovar Muenchen]